VRRGGKKMGRQLPARETMVGGLYALNNDGGRHAAGNDQVSYAIGAFLSSELLAFPVRRALFGERGGALDRVLAAEHGQQQGCLFLPHFLF
jgi:hypothetical protein